MIGLTITGFFIASSFAVSELKTVQMSNASSVTVIKITWSSILKTKMKILMSKTKKFPVILRATPSFFLLAMLPNCTSSLREMSTDLCVRSNSSTVWHKTEVSLLGNSINQTISALYNTNEWFRRHFNRKSEPSQRNALLSGAYFISINIFGS